jgi:hypothetical protein
VYFYHRKLTTITFRYCEREFDDEKVLITHQRAKHFKCPQCGKRMNTTGGLSIHYAQVHKETLRSVPNAIKGRDSVDIEIFGMEGVPPEDIIAHNASLGIPPQPMPKRVKIEPTIDQELTPEQIKEQLARHQAMLKGQALSPPTTAVPPMPYPAVATPAAAAAAAAAAYYPPQPMMPMHPTPYGYPAPTAIPPPAAPAPSTGYLPMTSPTTGTPQTSTTLPPPNVQTPPNGQTAAPPFDPAKSARPPPPTTTGIHIVYDDNAISVVSSTSIYVCV